MEYSNILKGKFIDRPNRFIANVSLNGRAVVCHVKNTGRCRELLVPDAEVYLQHFSNKPLRKTDYDLIAVKKGERLINMDSQASNPVAEQWLRENIKGLTLLKREQKYQSSRFDFYYEANGERAFVEVKGVTLENNGIVSFPDAPSQRAIKHLGELAAATRAGYLTQVIFVVQMAGVDYFTPNYDHPSFVEALKAAAQAGVKLTAFETLVTPDSIVPHKPVKIVL